MTQQPEHNTAYNSEQPPVRISTLAKRPDFLRIAAGRIKWVSGSMIVQVAKRPEGCHEITDIRVGYTASKKVGNAVLRNRVKRRLREVARHVLPNSGREGYDFVLIARSATVELPFDQLIRDFSWCLKRLNLSTEGDNQLDKPGKRRGKPEQPVDEGGKR